MPESRTSLRTADCHVAVLWIDWYPYHVARFRGLCENPHLAGRVTGIEMVGGIGVHAGLRFRETLPEGLEIETLMPETSWRDANKLQLAWRVWKKLSELDPEVVLVPGYYTVPAIAAAIWARLSGAASVLMTGSSASDHCRTWLRETVKSLGLRLLFNWAVVGGKAHMDYLHLLRFPAERVAGSYDVVDNDMFRVATQALRALPAQARADSGLPARPYFLYVGRLAQEKNVAGLLNAWLDYRARGGTWPLVVVGDGPEAAMLRNLAAASHHGADVLFAGLKASQALLPFYAFAGCFVLPSTREPWGLVVNEAMASALPVLVSKCCGCAPELVYPGRNGFTFDPANESALPLLLHRMETLAPVERERMGAASLSLIANVSPARFGRSIAAIARAAQSRTALESIMENAR